MKPPEHRLWMNLTELKGRIVRKLGAERSKQYFDYLNKFLSLKLSKVEFDKLCVRTVGKDGIPLHNQLIRSVLRNACVKEVQVGNKQALDGVCYQNGSGPIVNHGSSQLCLPNGDVFPTSPRKARTGRARKSALGPNGKSGCSQDYSNGNSPSENAETWGDSSSQKGGKDVSNRSSLRAPIGICYYPVSIGGSRKAAPAKSVGVSDTNCLLDTITLRARMEPIVATQGLQGVSMDTANALNIGLNAYLKGIIRSCSELTRPIKTGLDHFKPTNNSIPGHHYQTQEHETRRSISLQDFKVAMELNPQQLGEDSPILLERICTQAFEE